MIQAVLIYNESLSSPDYQAMLQLYVQGAKQEGIALHLHSNHSLSPRLHKGEISLGLFPKTAAFCLFLDKDIPLAQVIHNSGVPVYNSPQSIATCDNKILMTQALAPLPQPSTYFSTLQFFPVEESTFHQELEENLGFPLVVKEAYGSFGQQVYLAKNQQELRSIRQQIGLKPHLYQQWIECSSGIDLRLYVCGNDIIGAMKRENKSDFRANLSNGGRILPHIPTEAEKNLAISANKAVGTLFSGVDLLWDERGEPLLCEINASAHIKHYYDFTGENLALPIFREIRRQL